MCNLVPSGPSGTPVRWLGGHGANASSLHQPGHRGRQLASDAATGWGKKGTLGVSDTMGMPQIVSHSMGKMIRSHQIVASVPEFFRQTPFEHRL